MEDLHFTYNVPDMNNLKQGDILAKTPELLEVIKEVHPYYAGTEYLYFQVLTQSCDLELRSGKCNARYITIAVVRSLDDVIKRRLDDKVKDKITIGTFDCCGENKKTAVTEFLKSVFNNQEKDYFFIHKCPGYSIDIHCCTMLQLSISLRAYQHYDVCLKAKLLELEDNFKSRIGWMVGNLYSRVGTKDYVPSAISTYDDLNHFINEILKGIVIWVPKDKFSFYKKIVLESGETDLAIINRHAIQQLNALKTQRLTTVMSTIKSAISLSQEDEEKLKNAILQNPMLSKMLA